MTTRSKVTDNPLPPHDLEAEQAVLGSVLIDRDAIVHLAGMLQPREFFTAGHQAIYRAMCDLYGRHIPSDAVTLVAELKRTGTLDMAGGEVYVAELMAATPTAVHVDYYAGIVRDCYTRRQLIQAGQKIVQNGYDMAVDLEASIGGSELVLNDAVRGYLRGDTVTLDDVVSEYLAGMDKPPAKRLLFGMPSLDNLVQGITGGQLIVPAGLTGFGKSALALQWAVSNAVDGGHVVGVVSLEMNTAELGHRALAIHSGINSRKIAANALDTGERLVIEDSRVQLQGAPLLFLSSAVSTVEDVVLAARNTKATRGLDLLVIDYLQLLDVQGRVDGDVQRLTRISRALKKLAVELDIPVVALAQLNRAPWGRNDPTPILSDLRGSGSIEQDANLVIFLHKPGHFDTNIPDDLVNLIVAKNRSGPTGTVSMRFDKRTTRFFENRNQIRSVA